MQTRFACFLIALGLIANSWGCGETSTRLVVVMDTDYAVPSEVDTLELQITGPSGKMETKVFALSGANAVDLPVVVPLEAATSQLSPVALNAAARLGSQGLVQTAVRTEFENKKELMVKMLLLRSCRGAVCESGKTCSEGLCISETVASSELPEYNGRPAKYVSSQCAATVNCPAGKVCLGGRCMDPPPDGGFGDGGFVDQDSDGVAASIDCDDHNPNVRSVSQRSCSSSCGNGVEQCTNGVWDGCDAPTSCVCTPGQTQQGGSCGNCGHRLQRCNSQSQWEDQPGCTGEGECSAGAIGTASRACGLCGGSTETKTRMCSSICTWGDYGLWSGCGSPPSAAGCGAMPVGRGYFSPYVQPSPSMITISAYLKDADCTVNPLKLHVHIYVNGLFWFAKQATTIPSPSTEPYEGYFSVTWNIGPSSVRNTAENSTVASGDEISLFAIDVNSNCDPYVVNGQISGQNTFVVRPSSAAPQAPYRCCGAE